MSKRLTKETTEKIESMVVSLNEAWRTLFSIDRKQYEILKDRLETIAAKDAVTPDLQFLHTILHDLINCLNTSIGK